MKKTSLVFGISALFLAGASFAAESPTSEIRESTDPAKAAEVEQRAADIQARQQQSSGVEASGDSGTSGRMPGKRMHSKKHGHKAGKSKAAESTSGTSGTSGDTGAGSSGDQGSGSSDK